MADQVIEDGSIVYHKAAGGFVFTIQADHPMVALLVTHEGLGIPKGHIQHNEGIESAAIREVREETGIRSELKSLGQTSEPEYEFAVTGDTKKHTKKLHLFTFLTEELVPLRTEEDSEEIASVGWVDATNAKDFLAYQQADYEIAYQKAIRAINQ